MVALLRQSLPDLGIEVGIPSDWAQAQADHADVMYLADPEEGYRTNVALSGDVLDPPTPDRFDEVIAGVPDAITARHPDAEILGQARFAQNGLPAWFIRFRWHSDELEHLFEQLLAFVVVDPSSGRVVQLDGTTIAPLAEAHLPLLRAVLESVRALDGSTS